MYRAADGWVFLAAPGRAGLARPRDRARQVRAGRRSLGDERFATEASRAANAAALTTALEAIFATRAKDEWEAELTAADVGCVAVAQENAEWRMQDDEFYQAGYAVDAVSPIFDEHRRPAPLNRFSRSATKAGRGLPARPAHGRAAARARLRRRTDRRPAQAGRRALKEGTWPSRFRKP